MSYERVIYCVRCGHHSDCHTTEYTLYGSTELRRIPTNCSGFTKKGKKCGCPQMVRPSGMDRKAFLARNGSVR